MLALCSSVFNLFNQLPYLQPGDVQVRPVGLALQLCHVAGWLDHQRLQRLDEFWLQAFKVLGIRHQHFAV